jgi:hypothetical protein
LSWYGPFPFARTSSAQAVISSGCISSAPQAPSPPASITAIERAGADAPAIGASRIGSSSPKRRQNESTRARMADVSSPRFITIRGAYPRGTRERSASPSICCCVGSQLTAEKGTAQGRHVRKSDYPASIRPTLKKAGAACVGEASECGWSSTPGRSADRLPLSCAEAALATASGEAPGVLHTRELAGSIPAAPIMTRLTILKRLG